MIDAPTLSCVWPTPRSAYVHVPFCRHRCGYCNFSVIAGRDDLVDQFLTAIDCEMANHSLVESIDTLFIGGGTPTHLNAAQFNRLLDSIDRYLPRVHGAETTVEANPEDINGEVGDRLASRGVNRVSLGIQSFDDAKLKSLERSHTRDSALAAVTHCVETIGNVSVDLIFGAPGEMADHWREEMQTVCRLPIQHLSTYALTYEKGTAFWTGRARGALRPAGEDAELAMYREAITSASYAGLRQYEISSFARDGYRCRHNLAYWEGRGWFAFGPGAARFEQGRREVNHRSTTTYLRRIRERQSPVAESETISPLQYATERAAFGIRMIDGIDLSEIHAETGVDVAVLREKEIENCVRYGWLTVRGNQYQLTADGIMMADSVAAAFLEPR